MNTRKIKAFVFGIWALAGGGVIVIGVLFGGRVGAAPSSGGGITPTVPDTFTSTPLVTTPPSPTTQPTLVDPTSTPTIPPSPTTPPPSPSPTRPTPTLTPTLAQPLVIGKSVTGRPLEVYHFGDGDSERLIVAGVHGGYEWNTIALADELIAYLEEHPEAIPAGVRLYILRALNPDGEARSHAWAGRANENGVDVNRNFPTYWQADWPREGCWDYLPITAGAWPASEPETIALMGFVQHHNIEALISYHSAGLGIFSGGRPPAPASVKLAEALAGVSDYPYPPIDTGCLYTGQLADWAAKEGIAAVDIELTNHEDTDFEQNLAILAAFLNWVP